MNSALAHQRCFNHATREAAARCPECRRFFCRECVTEHDEKLLCAACLRRLAHSPLTARRWFAGLGRVAACVSGLFLAWLFFYSLGQALLALPSSFHEGTIWRGSFLDQQ